jgi:hypothetical protein
MAWYRFQITVPDGMEHVSLYLPSIRTSYEVYADGKLIGTYAKMPPHSFPYGGGSFRVYPLPPGRHGQEKIEVALRVWHWPGWALYMGGGPQHGGGLVGDTQLIEHRNELDYANSFRSLGSSEVLTLLSMLAWLGALALFLLRRSDREYLWFSLVMLFTAGESAIYVSESAVVWNIEFRDIAVQLTAALGALATIAFYQQLLQPRRTWLLKLAVAAVALNLVDVLIASLSGSVQGVWFENLVGTLCELILDAWIISVVLIRARQRSPDARLLVVPVAPGTLLDLLTGIAVTPRQHGWQQRFDGSFTLIEKPFPISFGDVTDAFFCLRFSVF